MGRPQGWVTERTGRAPMRSPVDQVLISGRPSRYSGHALPRGPQATMRRWQAACRNRSALAAFGRLVG
jgi:hypothetical protein